MNYIDLIVPWTIPKQKRFSDYFRILLGILILFKGVYFTINFHNLSNYFAQIFGKIESDIPDIFSQNIMILPEASKDIFTVVMIFILTYFFISHIIGGILLAIGLYTRWVCLIQLPILFAAIFIINLPKAVSSMENTIELVTSIFVFVGLAYFFINGAGLKSVDELRRRDLEQIEGLNH
jgi:uncharacterized membrane protein YphA (DoxX/SURF4 family)